MNYYWISRLVLRNNYYGKKYRFRRFLQWVVSTTCYTTWSPDPWCRSPAWGSKSCDWVCKHIHTRVRGDIALSIWAQYTFIHNNNNNNLSCKLQEHTMNFLYNIKQSGLSSRSFLSSSSSSTSFIWAVVEVAGCSSSSSSSSEASGEQYKEPAWDEQDRHQDGGLGRRLVWWRRKFVVLPPCRVSSIGEGLSPSPPPPISRNKIFIWLPYDIFQQA